MRRPLTLLRAALVSALIAVGALIAIPIGPVPVTLQVLVVAIAVLVLSPAEAFASVALYLALGAVGAPVFSGGQAGLPILLGPTGGFLWGFLIGAPLGAAVRRSAVRLGRGASDVLGLLALLVVAYATGLAQFALVTGHALAEAIALAVAPFVLLDAAKCMVAVAVARGVRAAGAGDAEAVSQPAL